MRVIKQCKDEVKSVGLPKVTVQFCSLPCANEWLFMATSWEKDGVARIEVYRTSFTMLALFAEFNLTNEENEKEMIMRIFEENKMCQDSLGEYYGSVYPIKHLGIPLHKDRWAAFTVSEVFK
jgi:hypothetical protein